MSLLERLVEQGDRRKLGVLLARMDRDDPRAAFIELVVRDRLEPCSDGTLERALALPMQRIDDRWLLHATVAVLRRCRFPSRAATLLRQQRPSMLAASWLAKDPVAMAPFVLDSPESRVLLARGLSLWRAPGACDAWDRVPTEQAAWGLFELGETDRALARLDEDGSAVWRARLALWREQPQQVFRETEGLCGAEVDALRCGASVVSADLASARTYAQRACDDPKAPASAWFWRAEVAHRLGEVGTTWVDEGWRRTRGDVVPRLLRLRAMQSAPHDPGVVRHHLAGSLGPGLSDLLDVPDPVTALLARLGSNRSGLWVEHARGELVARGLPPSPRNRGEMLQGLLHSRSLLQVDQAFAEAAAEDAHPFLLMYWGETRLWAGDVSGARSLFEQALSIDPSTLWARIGLGACVLYAGDPVRAIEVWDALAFDGPTVFAYRGEALFRLGRLEDAASQLSHAVEQKPTRLGAWLVLARVRNQQGDARLEDVLVTHLKAACPAWQALRADDPIEAALASLCGNRSSTVVGVPLGGHLQIHDWNPAGFEPPPTLG